MLASHIELGRERRYAFACVLEINDSNVHDSFRRFRNWIRQSQQPSVVELVERLGESSFAHVRRADDRLFVAEVRGREAPAPGERMTLVAAAQDVHVFDASGLRVSTQTDS